MFFVRDHRARTGTLDAWTSQFVVQAFAPDAGRSATGRQAVKLREVGVSGWHLEATVNDSVVQTLTSRQVVLTSDGVELYQGTLRYVWPSEVDLMCQLVRVSLVERFGGWTGQPYTGGGSHVGRYAPVPP